MHQVPHPGASFGSPEFDVASTTFRLLSGREQFIAAEVKIVTLVLFFRLLTTSRNLESLLQVQTWIPAREILAYTPGQPRHPTYCLEPRTKLFSTVPGAWFLRLLSKANKAGAIYKSLGKTGASLSSHDSRSDLYACYPSLVNLHWKLQVAGGHRRRKLCPERSTQDGVVGLVGRLTTPSRGGASVEEFAVCRPERLQSHYRAQRNHISLQTLMGCISNYFIRSDVPGYERCQDTRSGRKTSRCSNGDTLGHVCYGCKPLRWCIES